MPTIELKNNAGIPRGVLLMLTIMAGLSVANVYYCQPLLNLIREDLGVSEFEINLMPVCLQIGYALGLLLVVPLGDLWSRKRIVVVNALVLAVSLGVIAWAPSYHLLLGASLITGFCSVGPQIFIPIASQYSHPANKERNVGLILSGLLTGILLSRVISGLVGDWWGWREMFGIATGIMLLSAVLLAKYFPLTAINYIGSYRTLMGSLFQLLHQHRAARLYSLRAAFAFGSFLAMWACLAFKLKGAPFYAGSEVIGLFGLCGVAGALTASSIGRYIPRWGVGRVNALGLSLVMLAWLILYGWQNTYVGLIAGIVLIDIGMQCVQLSNQSAVLKLAPAASSRMNTIFMTMYFIGGALGTFLSGTFWSLWQWGGVAVVGLVMGSIACCLALLTKGLRDD